ncbi:TAR DNA-binding protein 43-like [Convolutriloba macropyga]|uniref:TAR DNA-binding protein 43-like n=1 Tax=Convolutriloba macropyga TaxID=536237 RepID=UPI003F521A98
MSSSYMVQDSGMAFMDQYILVALVENGEPVEVPVESDGTVLLSSIQSQYPQAIGIKFRNPATRAFRAVKLCDNILYPPSSENGWGEEDLVYVVNAATPVVMTYPNGAESTDEKSRKREASNEPIELVSKQNAKRILSSICSDLIVLNLPYTFSDEDLKSKFEEFGQLCLCEIKRDNDKKSRGYGFIRYMNYEDQKKVQGHMFMVEGRRVEVKKPKNNNTESTFGSSRVFVGQLDDSVSKTELMDYFEQFGDINSCFYEAGKKNYAFVEFEDPEIAKAVLHEKSHFIRGKHVVIRTADPRNKNQQSTSGGGDSGASSTPVRDRLEWDDARRGMGSASGSFSSPYGQFGMPGSYSSYGYGDRGDLPAGRQSGAMGGGSSGGFPGSEAMMSTMAKMMAEAVSQQLSQHLGPQNGQQNSRSYYDSNGARSHESSSTELVDRGRFMSR